jgi:hypothetical protein
MRTHSKDNSLQTRVANKMVYNVNLPNFIPRKQQDKRNRMDKRKKEQELRSQKQNTNHTS